MSLATDGTVSGNAVSSTSVGRRPDVWEYCRVINKYVRGVFPEKDKDAGPAWCTQRVEEYCRPADKLKTQRGILCPLCEWQGDLKTWTDSHLYTHGLPEDSVNYVIKNVGLWSCAGKLVGALGIKKRHGIPSAFVHWNCRSLRVRGDSIVDMYETLNLAFSIHCETYAKRDIGDIMYEGGKIRQLAAFHRTGCIRGGGVCIMGSDYVKPLSDGIGVWTLHHRIPSAENFWERNRETDGFKFFASKVEDIAGEFCMSKIQNSCH